MTGNELVDGIVVPVIWGLVFSVTTSGLWFFIMRSLRPNLVVWPLVAKRDIGGGSPEYRFKVVNRGRRDVVNISARVWVLHDRPVPGGHVKQRKSVPLADGELWHLKSFSRSDSEATYAYRFRTLFPLEDVLRADPSARLVMDIRGDDGISNITRVKRVEFGGLRGIRSGSHGFGASMDVEVPASPGRETSVYPPRQDPLHP